MLTIVRLVNQTIVNALYLSLTELLLITVKLQSNKAMFTRDRFQMDPVRKSDRIVTSVYMGPFWNRSGTDPNGSKTDLSFTDPILDPFRTGSRTVPCKQKPVRSGSSPVPCKRSLSCKVALFGSRA